MCHFIHSIFLLSNTQGAVQAHRSSLSISSEISPSLQNTTRLMKILLKHHYWLDHCRPCEAQTLIPKMERVTGGQEVEEIVKSHRQIKKHILSTTSTQATRQAYLGLHWHIRAAHRQTQHTCKPARRENVSWQRGLQTYIHKLPKVKVKALSPDLKAILHKTLYVPQSALSC